MDEPQISSEMDVDNSDVEKSNLDEVLEASFNDGENSNKAMDVDNSDVSMIQSTSAIAPDQSEQSNFEENLREESISKSPTQDAGVTEIFDDVDENSEEQVNQTMEEVNFEKTGDDLDSTQAAMDDTLEYTEKSINISHLNVEQGSNDAFDALKQTKEELDTFDDLKNTENEENTSNFDSIKNTEEEKQLTVEEEGEKDMFDTLKNSEDYFQKEIPKDASQENDNQDASIQIETDQNNENDDHEDHRDYEDDNYNVASTSADAETDIQPSEILSTELGESESADKTDSGFETAEKAEEVEDEETEATNQGEGVDENVCLFGDAEERELTDADKERAVQPAEILEEEESTSGETTEIADKEPTSDEVMEVDSEQQLDKEQVETEEIEEEGESHEPETEPESVDQSVPLKENEIREEPSESEETCLNCENVTMCQYRLLEETGEIKFLCTYSCVGEHREDNPDKYTLTQKKIYIYEIPPAEFHCSKCNEMKSCKYQYRITVTSTITKDPPAQPTPTPPQKSSTEEASSNIEDTISTTQENTATITEEPMVEGDEAPAMEMQSETATETPATAVVEQSLPQEPIIETVQSSELKHLCDDNCLKELIGDNTEKYIVKEIQRRSMRTREKPKRYIPQEEQEVPKIVARTEAETEAARIDREESFIRRCTQCFHEINFTSKTVQWETLDFCNEKCLGLYQNLIGATCVQCNEVVTLASIGKLCVRFGFDIKQFCSSKCLDEFKKSIKHCALCQRNLIDEENILLAQVGEKRVYRDFCDQQCLQKYLSIMNPKKKYLPYLCSVCNYKKPAKIEVVIDENTHRFCSSPCFSAFKFVNNVVADQCDMCAKYFERKSAEAFTIYQMTESKIFCTRICMNLFICKTREIWQCNWCKVSKYNYDMIQMNFGKIQMCSLNCLSLHEVSLNALTPKRSKCAHCKLLKQPQYHLTMSDASIRNFCTYQCAIGFQGMFSKNKLADDPSAVVPAGTAKRIKPSSVALEKAKQQASVPIISRVQSLSSRRGRHPYNPVANRPRSPIPVPELTVQLERLSDLPSRVRISSFSSGASSWTPIPSTSRATTPTPVRVEHKTQVVTIPALPKAVSNKSTMCKSITLNKAISAIPSTVDAECQTDDYLEKRFVLPVPVPIFVPQPMYMYNMPTIIPVPIPLPIPVPVFIPTTRNSAQGIMKEIKKIQDKMPTDPYEAELLMMAEMVAGDRKREETESDSDENDMEYGDGMENNSSFNEDLVQMAFKMASGNDFDDPPVDLENEMTANTISQNAHGYDDMDPHTLQHHQLLLLHQQREAAMQAQRGRKRMQPTKPNNNRNNTPNKRIKREMEVMQPEMPREPAEKPDANMCLKYTFGVNAWKQWVATKNADFEKSSIRRKPIKSEILQLTADELNYSLCMFVKEVRKPNGSEYAPDTIYYLVLGIQQYLYENGRIDNIFTDRYYEQFTDCLDEVAKKFSVLYNDSQYIVTRVEEEHLWECKQLGAHSPHVLLSTLMFFNTKHFNLVTVDEHMELSFSHIMKHWKRNPNQPGAAKMPGSRNVLLRFYPPQSSLEANSRKKKVYEQQENEENPLRCPVKLYEFYLSKCPESVKTRNDVFYLQPERSCVPDSPVWYSTQALSREALSKMLHRVKMVKEINIALLTS